MLVKDFSNDNSILNQFISELRNINIQQDRMRFRRNLERVGEILAYELSKTLTFAERTINTPLGRKQMNLIESEPVLCSILRAGLPMHNGVLNHFDSAENTFISAFRKHNNDDNEFEVVVEYVATPSIEGKTLILIDPMLATGASMVSVYQALLKFGKPKVIHIVSVIGSKQGVDYIATEFPKDTTLWIATVDDKLNDRGYIVPGLGDAGDLAYGAKL
ncbi:MAG: uracil phosphoribosyltransferase [Flavobacteriales bacterium]|nr:uracil phosphoribosyltransferase [Flavobacteriales bacterium]